MKKKISRSTTGQLNDIIPEKEQLPVRVTQTHSIFWIAMEGHARREGRKERPRFKCIVERKSKMKV